MSEVAHTPQLRFPEFIGEWDVTNFGNISSIKRGASPRPISSPKWFDKDSSVGWVRISDVTKSKKYLKKTEQYLSEDGINRSRKVDKGNLIMSICATIGKPIYTNFNVCIHDGFIVFDSLSEDKGFIYYLLEKIQKKWYRYGQPGTQVNLNSDIVSSEIFSIPTKPEQQKIAAFLTAVDNKIEQLSKKQELLGEYKKGLTQQIFSQAIRFKAGDGSDFPDWEEKKLGDVFEIKAGQSKSKHIKKDGKNIIVDMGGISSEPKLVAKKLTDYDDDFLTTNDLVMPKDDIGGGLIIGKVAEIPENNKYICGDHIYKLTVVNGNITFLKYAINSYQVNKSFRQKANGTAQIGLSRKEVENQLLSFPSLKEQTKIANFLSSIDSKIEQVGKQLNESKQFKKALLQQMFV